MEQQIQAKADDKILAGAYTNFAQIAHTKDEFVIDFFNLFPPAGILTARIVTSPANFKRVVQAMQENLEKYEKQYKPIEGQSETQSPKIGFKTN